MIFKRKFSFTQDKIIKRDKLLNASYFVSNLASVFICTLFITFLNIGIFIAINMSSRNETT